MSTSQHNEDAVIQEAEAFLNEMSMDGFAIDSDEEVEDLQSGQVVVGGGSQMATAATANGSISREGSANALQLHPLSDELLDTPPAPASITSSNHGSGTTTPTATTQTSSPQQQQEQQQQPLLQDRAISFASQISSFAQRAAVQIDKMSDKMVSASVVPEKKPLMDHVVELDSDQKSLLIQTHMGELLTGEKVIMFLSNLLHVGDSSQQDYIKANGGMWCCAMTFYRVALFHTSSTELLLQMPLASIDKVEKNIYNTSALPKSSFMPSTTLMGLVLYGKDNGRQLKFTTPSYNDTLRAYESLQTYAFPGRKNLGYLFAFESKRAEVMASIVTNPQGVKTITLQPTRRWYSPQAEYDRLQLSNSKFYLWTQTNHQYQLCMSYPSQLIGPFDETDAMGMRVTRQCGAFRSEGRLPACTWASPNGGSLWRASQPKVGLQGNRSMADEAYLQKIANTRQATQLTPKEIAAMGPPSDVGILPNTESLKILDLRPKSSAMANRTGGYGYENTSYYKFASLQFCNIGNIHAVRDAYQKLSGLLLNESTSDVNFGLLVEETRWLTQVRLILSAAWQAAFLVILQTPVLLHCSHGWDRTGQVAALAQILLDPYYRTLEGVCCLMEKDFMAFGHPFHTRCSHGDSSSSGENEQTSPIFIQFLDCLYQIVRLYPNEFEYNTHFLFLISEHVYSCRFGNMLCDTERERDVVANLRQRTHCLWEYLLGECRLDIVNPNFDSNNSNNKQLWMSHAMLLRNVVLWKERHSIHGPKPFIL